MVIFSKLQKNVVYFSPEQQLPHIEIMVGKDICENSKNIPGVPEVLHEF